MRSEHDRQRYLESQVRAVQQRLVQLRNEFAHSGSASGRQARLDAIQHALARFWPSAAGFSTAGTSEAQFRYEREQLTLDIGIVEQQHQDAQRIEAANSAPRNPLPQQGASPAPQPQPAATAPVPSPPASGATRNPFHLVHMAGLPARMVWWPSALIGCSCGLLYWGLAFILYRSSPKPAELFDPSVPSSSREAPEDAYPAVGSSRRRAPFIYDPVSISASVPDESTSPEPVQGAIADTVFNSLAETAVVPTPIDMTETAFAADAVDHLRAPDEPEDASREKIAEMADPWRAEICKNLSQTTIARTMDAGTWAEEIAAKIPAREVAPPPSRPTRLAS